MKISQDIRDEAKAGMAQKAAEFREAGGEIYMPKIAEFLIARPPPGCHFRSDTRP